MSSVFYEYFDYDGLPARLTINATSHHIELAETYFKGKGFAPVAFFPIKNEGKEISEKTFKELVVKQLN